MTWNIQSGGGTRVPQIMQVVKQLEADFVALTEVTHNNLSLLRQSLLAAGFPHIETTCPTGRVNSVLVASRSPFTVGAESVEHDRERWLPVRFEDLDLNVLSVHVPDATTGKFDSEGHGFSGKRRKQMFWDELIRYAQAHKSERTVLLGDFNTGLKEDAQGIPFVLSENIRILRLEKYADTWRHLNPKAREYTWYSKQKGADYNGFRLDYVFVSSPLRDSIVNAQHGHQVRIDNLSDHALMWADIGI